MHGRAHLAIFMPILSLSLLSCGKSDDDDTASTVPTRTAVLSQYAVLVHSNYAEALDKAEELKAAIDGFVAAPDNTKFEAVKTAWLASRDPYGQTEAFRFYSGPIDQDDGPEGRINAWPLDEAYLDAVVGNPTAGIINKPDIVLTKERIANLNEGGEDDVLGTGAAFDPEKAIASGYHAIEFLLWGQDNNATGPGQRAWTDYTTAANATRRGEYLKLTAELLVDDLQSLVDAWDPADSSNYRNADFLKKDETAALKAILTAIGILAKGELGGERIDVALDSGEQEDEHSCFSDNTNKDLYANALGIQNVYLGRYGSSVSGASISQLVAAVDPSVDATLKEQLQKAVDLSNTMPTSFDQYIGDRNSEGWKQANELVVTLQEIGNSIVSAGQKLGLGTISVELPE